MARKIIASLFVSLDGVIQSPGGIAEDTTGGFDQGGWVFKMWDDGIDPALGELFDRPFDLLLGRRTYDIFAAYWPYATGEAAAMGEAFTAANKFVLTRGSKPLEWENGQRLGNIAEVALLKQSDGPDLLIQGSGTLYPDLLAAGLIDRLTLMVFPLTLGKGKRWIGDAMPAGSMKLIDHCVTQQGTVIATYEPAGPLPPMPNEAPEPSTSVRETRRQTAMKDGMW